MSSLGRQLPGQASHKYPVDLWVLEATLVSFVPRFGVHTLTLDITISLTLHVAFETCPASCFDSALRQQ